MAELIDKNGAIKLIEKEFDMNCLTEWGQGYIDAMKDVKGIIALLPTTTEAEIRAMAYERFAEKLSDAYSEHSTTLRLHGVDFDILTVDGAIEIMWDLVSEQLKEE